MKLHAFSHSPDSMQGRETWRQNCGHSERNNTNTRMPYRNTLKKSSNTTDNDEEKERAQRAWAESIEESNQDQYQRNMETEPFIHTNTCVSNLLQQTIVPIGVPKHVLTIQVELTVATPKRAIQ